MQSQLLYTLKAIVSRLDYIWWGIIIIIQSKSSKERSVISKTLYRSLCFVYLHIPHFTKFLLQIFVIFHISLKGHFKLVCQALLFPHSTSCISNNFPPSKISPWRVIKWCHLLIPPSFRLPFIDSYFLGLGRSSQGYSLRLSRGHQKVIKHVIVYAFLFLPQLFNLSVRSEVWLKYVWWYVSQ